MEPTAWLFCPLRSTETPLSSSTLLGLVDTNMAASVTGKRATGFLSQQGISVRALEGRCDISALVDPFSLSLPHPACFTPGGWQRGPGILPVEHTSAWPLVLAEPRGCCQALCRRVTSSPSSLQGKQRKRQKGSQSWRGCRLRAGRRATCRHRRAKHCLALHGSLLRKR